MDNSTLDFLQDIDKQKLDQISTMANNYNNILEYILNSQEFLNFNDAQQAGSVGFEIPPVPTKSKLLQWMRSKGVIICVIYNIQNKNFDSVIIDKTSDHVYEHKILGFDDYYDAELKGIYYGINILLNIHKNTDSI